MGLKVNAQIDNVENDINNRLQEWGLEFVFNPDEEKESEQEEMKEENE